MPQLDPDPWLYISLSAWLSLLLLAPAKLLYYLDPYSPKPLSQFKTHKMWTWPWQ